VKDGPALAALKALVRAVWTVELGLRRQFGRRRRYLLAGACAGCAKCCERPTIRVGLWTWWIPPLRRLFVAWQRRVNGFELVAADRETRSLAFRCSHFDPRTRRCDSYGTRPFLCRDYPRALLDDAWPEFFPGCGYRPVAPNAERLRRALEQSGLPAEKVKELAERMYLD
jgi:Fe-S-cluster containining protein